MNDLVGVADDRQVRVVCDDNCLSSTGGLVDRTYEARLDGRVVEVLLGLVEQEGRCPAIHNKIEEGEHQASLSWRQLLAGQAVAGEPESNFYPAQPEDSAKIGGWDEPPGLRLAGFFRAA